MELKKLNVRQQIIINSIISVLVVSLLMSVYFIYDNYNYFKDDIMEKTKTDLSKIKSSVEEVLDNYVNIMKQINSRTMIRAKMEDYDKGKTDIKELSKFSTPKLQDAIKEVGDLECFMRIDVYNNVVSKIVKSDYLDNYNLSKIDKSVFISEPFIIKDKNLVLVSSDIISSYGKIIGKDIAIFRFNKIRELEKITDKIAIVNQNRIIYSNRDNLKTINMLSDDKNIVFEDKFSNTSWKIYQIINREKFYKNIYANIKDIAIVILIIILLGIINGYYISKPLAGKILLNQIELNKEIEVKTQIIVEENKIKEEMYTIIAHDLRSPIAGTVGILKMLNDSWDELSEEEKKEFISIGNVALENQLELMDNLLRWVKERREESILKNELINIYELLASIKKLYYPLLEKKKINLEIKSEKDILIKNDSELIAVVFRNIIANSIKFTKYNGFINVIVIKEKEEIIIEFVDNGIGIKKEILENMEKEIFTSTTIGTSGEKGTGFGLGIVIEFIKKCNGTYKIESKEGEGTKIIVRFKGNN